MNNRRIRLPFHLIFFISISVFFTIIFFISNNSVYAQSTATSCAVTKIGAPEGEPELPEECKKSGGSCKAPPASYPSDLAAAIAEKWDIHFMEGFGDEQLKAVYEIFSEIEGASFLEHIAGTYVSPISEMISSQVGCPDGPFAADVNLSTGYSPDATKVIIVHELAHVFQMCAPNETTHFSEIAIPYTSEGGLTDYSRTGCGVGGGIDLHNEDHAETIAYHLNPNSSPQTGACADPLASNPYDTGKFPLHKSLAESAVGVYSCSE